jgi:hypothetical protein
MRDVMDERIRRFKHCDARFYAYLDQVFSRLPEDLREGILNNKGFQIMADSELPNVCGRLFSFDHPVESMVYLNPRALMQADHRLLCTIAWEMAEYVLSKEEKGSDRRNVEGILVTWGFEQEMDGVRYCDAISGSATFKSGYEWARKQSKEYLMAHFGLEFDEWNKKGLRKLSRERLEMLRARTAPSKIIPGMRKAEPKRKKVEGFSEEEAAIEGIMMALKEIRLALCFSQSQPLLWPTARPGSSVE